MRHDRARLCTPEYSDRARSSGGSPGISESRGACRYLSSTCRSGPARRLQTRGSSAAPIVCEIYTDYECPACAAFYRDVFPALEANYVRTGKLRVIHHDFPLPMHPYAVPAARYADAAGELGYYLAVFPQLFATQKEWAAAGDLDRVVSAVVPPEKMVEVRKRVAATPRSIQASRRTWRWSVAITSLKLRHLSSSPAGVSEPRSAAISPTPFSPGIWMRC